MPTHVYANGLEIACQAADGIASPAFPDPCWTPPPPPAGPVVIPYANTAHPKTLKKGSHSVFIGGKPVALADSYFSTSIGDEPATPGLAKGVMTGVIKGKACFRSHSMNVKIEGKGVARHLDLMTHNHGSNPGNTPPAPYLSRAWREDDKCEQDRQRVMDECSPDGELTDEYCAGLQDKARGFTNAKAYRELKKVRIRIAKELKGQKDLEPFKDLRAGFNDFKGRAIQFNKRENINTDGKRRAAQTLTAEGQGMLAELNACLRARKCTLVPYKNQDSGCCKGQTGHHLIPEAMIDPENGGECEGYNHGKAPTVCVEGVGHSQGTHGRVHSKMDEVVGKIVTRGYLEVDGKPKKLGADGKMDLELAIEAAATSHAKAFPKSGCSRDCIKAQLNEYYGKTCSGGKFATVKKGGQRHKPHDAEYID